MSVIPMNAAGAGKRDKRPASHKLWFSAAVACFAITAASGLSDDDIGAIRKKVEERVSKFRTVDLTWKVTSHFTQEHGKRVGTAPFSDGKSQTQGKFPATIQWQVHLRCDGPKLRLEFARPSWMFELSKFETHSQIQVFDGIVGKSLTTYNQPSFANQGIIANGPMNALWDLEFSPIVWHFRAFTYQQMFGQRFFDPAASVSRELFDGRNTIVLKRRIRSPSGSTYEKILLLDPDADYAIRRYSIFLNSRLANDLRVTYTRDKDGHVLPQQWRFEEYNTHGLLLISHAVEVVEVIINQSIEDTVFKLEFPRGTTVTDQRGNREKYMLIGSGGREYPTTPQKTSGAASPEELLTLLEMEHQHPREWPLLILALAILASAFVAVVRYWTHRKVAFVKDIRY